MSSPDTTRRFLRSAGAATFSQAWRVLVTFGTRLLLRRLVPEGDWGIWDWALVLYLVLGAVRDLGLVYHVVREERPGYGNLLFVETIWSLALGAAAFFAAPWFATGFRDASPDTVAVLQLLVLFLLFDGLASVPRVYFERELDVGKAVVPELVRNALFAGLSVGLAWAGWAIWALAVAYVASTGVYALMLWVRAWGKIPLRFEPSRLGPQLAASLPLAFIFLLHILAKNVDPLILGAQFDRETVGNYGFAFDTALLVTTIMVPPIARALYPALVAYRGDPGRSFEAYRLATLFVLAIEVPAMLFLYTNAELAVWVLGGTQWEGAPTFLRILCFAPLIDPFSRLGGELLKTLHQDKTWIASLGLTLASFVVLGVLLTGRIGPNGMAWANYLPLGGVVMAWALWRNADGRFASLATGLAKIYLIGIPGFVLLHLVVAAPWLRFGLSLAVGAAVLGVYWLLFGADFLRFFKAPRPAPAPEAEPS